MGVCLPTATSTPFIQATSVTFDMRGLGDNLVVALIGDKNFSFPFQQKERADALSLLGVADAVLLLKVTKSTQLSRYLSQGS